MSAVIGALRGPQLDAEILVDGPAFWSRLKSDIVSARERVWVQTLSFEGDVAGRALADAVSASHAADRRILVDSFTRVIVNDRLIHAPWNLLDRTLMREVRAGRSMIASARRAGVAIQFGSPLGFLLRRLPARDHKKIIVVDRDVAYIGGINFSDHNFQWHDLMLRIAHPGVAQFLARDFRAAWEGAPAAQRARFGPLEVLSLDGNCNAAVLDSLLARIRAARRCVHVFSPYLTEPFLDALANAHQRGAHITIVTPAANNRDFLRRHVIDRGLRAGFDVRLYNGMSHLKAMLIDNTQLIVGSSNFDWLSYTSRRELLAIIRDRHVIHEFHRRVLGPDLLRSAPAKAVSRLSGRLADLQVAFLRSLARCDSCGRDNSERQSALIAAMETPMRNEFKTTDTRRKLNGSVSRASASERHWRPVAIANHSSNGATLQGG
ncbi:MAG: phospholipase D-like domain-containing protein [Longimicrobiales bacterium]